MGPMKIIVFSDIHGSSIAANALRRLEEKYSPDLYFCLGDILAAGEGSEIIQFFQLHSSKIVAVKGNCDSRYDESLLNVALREQRSFDYLGHTCHLRHIPFYDAISFPPSHIVMYGHTHRKVLYSEKGVLYLNPGSLALPRDGIASYALMEDGVITLRERDTDAILHEFRYF